MTPDRIMNLFIAIVVIVDEIIDFFHKRNQSTDEED